MAQRSALIKAIHAGRRRLGLNEDEYRAYLRGVVSKESLRDMTDAQLLVVMMRMRADGFSPKEEQKQIAYVRSLWLKLYDCGAVKDKAWKAMDRYASSMIGHTVKVNDLSRKELSKVIEHLKKWTARVAVCAE